MRTLQGTGGDVAKVRVFVLFMAGYGVWLTVGRAVKDWHAQVPFLIIPVAARLLIAIPLVRRTLTELFELIRNPSPRTRRRLTLIIIVASAVYLCFTAHRQHRYLKPIWPDEFSFVIQMRLLSGGRLWLASNELGPFFDALQMIVEPVYASMYSPGTSLMYWWTIPLHLPTWVLPMLAASLCVGLLYAIVSELVDGLAGLLAALMLVSIGVFRTLSMMVMAQVPVLLLGLALIWVLLRWSKSHRIGWALVIGILGGWASITRPADAFCFALPVALAMMIDLLRGGMGLAIRTAAVIILAAAPFIGMQLFFNRGITGQWLTMPWELYVDQHLPGLRLGFRPFDAAARPTSTVPQIQAIFDEQYVPMIKAHQTQGLLRVWKQSRLPRLVEAALPQRMLLWLAPVGLLAMGGRRWILVSLLPVFVAFYAMYAVFLEHYCIIAAPALIILTVLGIDTLRRNWPSAPALTLAPTLTLIGLCLASLPEASRRMHDQYSQPRSLMALEEQIRTIDGRALVLCRYDPSNLLAEEIVYNTSTARPEDGRIVLAHDRGENNRTIFNYFARTDPQRSVYLFDRSDGSLARLGSVAGLAAQ